MRFHFPNLDRPKKAAKHIARLLGGRFPLSKIQNGMATALGYRDWHELGLAYANGPVQPLDQDLPPQEFRRRNADLALSLATALEIPEAKAQAVLVGSRLTGGDQSVLQGSGAVLSSRERQVKVGSYMTMEGAERFYPVGDTIDWNEISFGPSSFDGAGRLWPVMSGPDLLHGAAHDRVDPEKSWAGRIDKPPIEATINQWVALFPRAAAIRPSWLSDTFKAWPQIEGIDISFHTMARERSADGRHLRSVSGPGIIVNSQIAGGIGEGWWVLSSPEDAPNWEFNLTFAFGQTTMKRYYGIPAFRLPD